MSDTAFNLYVISFTAGKEAGLAMVSAPDDRSAFQILKNGGSRHGDGYSLRQCRNIGMSTSCVYGLLLESFVNAREAYDAITQVVDRIARGEKGEKGDRGDVGPLLFDRVNVSVDESTGTPVASATVENNVLNLVFGGLKGETGATGTSVTRIDQTLVSDEDGGRNEFTIYMDDGTSKAISFRNGKRGITSVTADVDSLPGTPRAYCSLTEEGVLNIQFYGLRGAQGAPGAVNTTMVEVDSLSGLTPSEDTKDIIYLVYDSSVGKYKRYYTAVNGDQYTFVQMGTTDIDLSDYKRKDSEVWLTQEEFDAIEVKDITKTYNIYEEEEESYVNPGSGSGGGSSGGGFYASLEDTA